MMLIVELCALLEERNRLSAGPLPRTPMGLLTSLPDPLAVFRGPPSKGDGREGLRPLP